MTTNIKYLLIPIISLFACFPADAQTHSTGLIFDDDAYKRIQRLSPALRFSDATLPAYSLKSYCPQPGDQGKMGSCVGWAIAYAALTIADAIHSNNTNSSSITSLAKSPLYVYNQVKNENCVPGGANIERALVLVKNKGVCKLSEFNPEDCFIQPTSSVDVLAREFKITDYYRLFDVDDFPETKIINTINSLLANKPVVVGMAVTNSIDNPINGEWIPSAGEPITGGHALCVIGFDNQTRRFEIVNSWGAKWGNRGFFKMSYENFGKYCKYGFQFSVESPHEEQTVLSGVFRFKKYQGFNSATNEYEFNEVKPILTDNKYYTFAEGVVRQNDFFRIVASDIQKDNFVYIFSIKPNNDSEILFPLTLFEDGATIKDIPIVPAKGVSIEIPVDKRKGITTDQVGDDFLCILYSKKKINDIESVIAKVKHSSGEFYDRLENALGNRLVPKQNITYQPDMMRISTSSSTGYVAPIVLKVHVID